MIPAFGDSDDEDIQQDSELREEPDHDSDIMHRSPLCPPPPPRRPLPPSPPLDMALFLQRTSNYDLQKVFETAAAVTPIPQHVLSERPGCDARRAVMKARAAELTRLHSLPAGQCRVYSIPGPLHGLPPLPEDRSDTDVHGILQPEPVILITSTYITYCTSFTYGAY